MYKSKTMRRTIYLLLFVLTLIQNALGQMNCASNTCLDAEQLTADTPNTCDDGEIINVKHSCLGAATPSPEIQHCGVDSLPTVWFQINPNLDNAYYLMTLVEAEGFRPVWSVYYGQCDSLIPMEEAFVEESYLCSDSDQVGYNNHLIQLMRDSVTNELLPTWIAVSGYPLSGEDSILDDQFSMYYIASVGCLACNGGNSYNCDNGDFTAKVNGQFYDPDGDGVAGPFTPGLDVEVCWAFNFDTTGTGNDWLHGMIPTFGNGWDIENIDIANIDIGGDWEWFDSNGSCAPHLNENVEVLPNICTYTEDGVLKICNKVCNPSCPCVEDEPVKAGDPLPGGWFWNSPAPCGDESGCPNGSYGIDGGVNVDVEVCLDLKVKDQAQVIEHEGNRDLQIFVQPTDDGISGCWMTTSPCVSNPSMKSPKWQVSYIEENVLDLEELTLCSSTMVGFALEDDLNESYDISIIPVYNEFITGANNQSLSQVDNFNIEDVLTNSSGMIESQYYVISGAGLGNNITFTDTLVVNVYPELAIDFDPLEVCQGDTISFNVLNYITGGTGNYIDFVWSPNLESSPSIIISDENISDYCVTVTDDYGCTVSSCVEVLFEQQTLVEVAESELVCNNDIGIGPSSINLEDYLLQGSGGLWTSLDGIFVSDNIAHFLDEPFGFYSFEYSVPASENCSAASDTLVVEVVLCDCPIYEFIEMQTFCLSEVNSFDLNDLIIQADEGTWSLAEGNELILNGSVLDLSTASAGMYEFVYNLNMPIQGCPSSQTITLDLIDIEAELFLTPVQCFGESNGEFRVVTIPFNGLFSYLWEDGSEEDRITDLSGGEYMVTVTHDESQCQEVFSAYIPEPAELVVVIEPNGDSLQAIVTGGVETYTYIWSTGAFTTSILPEEAGEYSVTIIDDNSCMSTAYFNYVSTVDQLIDIDVYPNPFRDEIVIEGDLGEVDEVKLIDPLGRFVQATITYNSSSVRVSIDDATRGIYYLHWTSRGRSYYQRIVRVD